MNRGAKRRFWVRAAAVFGLCAALAASAADQTWSGGSSGPGDGYWTTGANWSGGTAPAADDALFFGGTARLTNTNDLDAGTSFSGLTFNAGAGAFTLRGNAIALGGSVVNLDNDIQTLNLDLALAATRLFNASNGNLVANGVLSGAGGLTKSGYYALTLTNNNTYEGLTTISTGTVVITHANALGSTASGTTVDTSRGAVLDIRGGLTLTETLTFTGANVNRSCLINGGGTNTISSKIYSSGGRHSINGGTVLNIVGGITNNPFFVINGSGLLNIRTTPLTMGTGGFYADDFTLTVIEVASNQWGELTIAKGVVRMGVANALPPGSPIRIGLNYGTSGTLDLNGFDQTTARLYNGTTSAGSRFVTSLTPVTLTITQSLASSTFDGVFSNAVSLLKQGAGAMILTNGVSPNTGSYTVSGGTLVVSTTARLTGATNIVVEAGTLELCSVDALNDGATLSVADGGAKVKISAGRNETVKRLALGGVDQPKGTYGATGSDAATVDNAHFAGTGVLTVKDNAPVTLTWDAEGADLNVSTPANWVGDALAPFDGETTAVFGTGGVTAAVDRTVGLYRMVFNSASNFVVAAGSGLVTNGPGGLFAQTPTTASRTYTLAEDVVLAESQTWTVTNNGAGFTTLSVTGVIDDGPVPCNLAKAGTGVLALSGANTFDGAFNVRTAGVLRISNPAALGSTNGATTVENGAYMEVSGGVTVGEPLTIVGDGAVNYAGVLRSTSGSNVWSGPIVSSGSRIRSNSGNLDILGGVTGGQFVLGADNGSSIRVAGKPISISGGFFTHSAGGTIVLAVTNNAWTQLEVGNRLTRLDLPGVLPPTAALQLGSPSARSAYLDLSGNDQTVGTLRTAWPGPEERILFSAAPATLIVNQSGSSEYSGSLTGAVTLVKAGAGNLVLSATNATYGGTVVAAGALTVSGTGRLGENSLEVRVDGGTLTLSNSVALSDAALVRIANGGGAKINLAGGVNESVRNLYFGDKQKRVGTYGSPDSPAEIKDSEHFSGAGVLTVLRDDFGTLISVQ